MATSAELLKAIKGGAEVRITFDGGQTGGLVEYSPRYKGDRKAWAYTDNTGMVIRYAAKGVAAVTPAPAPVKRASRVIDPKPVGSVVITADTTVCICPRMEPPAKFGHHIVCPLRATDTDTEETNDVSIKEGPLTERQVRIIEGLLAGKRHEEISRDLSTPDETVTVNVVKQECMNITAKFKAKTITQAVFIYSEAKAYRKAAQEILKTRIPVPFDTADEHANHVLEGLAELYQGRHDAWMPQ